MTLLGNPTRKRGFRRIFLSYAFSSLTHFPRLRIFLAYAFSSLTRRVTKQHYFVPAALERLGDFRLLIPAVASHQSCSDTDVYPFIKEFHRTVAHQNVQTRWME